MSTKAKLCFAVTKTSLTDSLEFQHNAFWGVKRAWVKSVYNHIILLCFSSGSINILGLVLLPRFSSLPRSRAACSTPANGLMKLRRSQNRQWRPSEQTAL